MSDATAELARPAGVGHLAGKYLTFRLGAEEYGLEILQVREIIGLMPITGVPQTPDYVRGVINLRGKIFPVVDLRLKFDMAAAAETPQTCIIVVEVHRDATTLAVGVVVDEVCEVRDIAPSQIDPTPDFGALVTTDFILGIGKIADEVIMLLDINRVLTDDVVAALAAAA